MCARCDGEVCANGDCEGVLVVMVRCVLGVMVRCVLVVMVRVC